MADLWETEGIPDPCVPSAVHMCVQIYYCYQQQDGLVNVQAMIEDTLEKNLFEQKSQYIQEQTALSTRIKITMIYNRTSNYS